MIVSTHVSLYRLLVLMYRLLCQSIKGLPPSCHTYDKLFSVLETIMANSFKQFTYTIAYKVEVIQYVKEHGNRAAETHFVSLMKIMAHEQC